MKDPDPSGFLLIDKDGGWTSHDAVAEVRRSVGGKIGHAGTLDPMATGLLVLGVGRSTRLLRFVQQLPKEYVATAVFGVATDSLDADGSVVARSPLPVAEDDLRAALGRFTGRILQVPPMVSARKVEGRRLYALAREGKTVAREARAVEIHSFDLIDIAPSDYPEVRFRVRCSTGTYVRTLADDLARSLGGRAHLSALRRTRIGSLTVAGARRVSAVTEAVDAGAIAELLLPPAEALADLDGVSVTREVERAVRHGTVLPAAAVPGIPEGEVVRLLDPQGRLLGIYRVEGDRAVAEVVTA